MRDSIRPVHSRLDGMWSSFNQSAPFVLLLVAVTFLAGCHGDPALRKQKYLESGNRYSANGRYKEAAIQYLNALKLDEEFGQAHYGLAQAYVHMSQFGAGYREFQRTIALQPSNEQARIDLGTLLLAGGHPDDAQAQANAVLAAHPSNSDAHALLSAVAAKQGKKDQALSEIQRALELEPNRASFHEVLALLQSDDPSKVDFVEDHLKKAAALDPTSMKPKLLLAGFYARNGRWSEAETISQGVVAANPKSSVARENLAQIYLRKGDQSKAEEVLRQASHDLADTPEGGRILADYYVNSGQMDKAKEEFSKLTTKYPNSLSLHTDYVRLLFQQRDNAEAQTLVREMMKNHPKDPGVTALNGIVLLKSGNVNDAVNVLQDATRNSPNDAFLQYWLGRAAVAWGDNVLAEASFRRAASLKPSNLEAQEQLARIASLRGDMELLSEVANKTIAAAPRFPDGYVWRATAEMSRDAPDHAETDLTTATRVGPNNPQAYLQFAKLRFIQKRFPEGVAFLEQALQYDPNSVEAMRLLISYEIFQKRADKALARLSAQMLRSPQNSGFYDLLARLQIYNRQLDQAAASAQRAISLNPEDGEAVMLYAQVQVQRGQTATGVGAWQEWLKAHPNDASALAVLGTLEEARGDEPKAVAYYKRSLQIQPQQPIAANNLAYTMLENGQNVDVALTYAQTARQAMQHSPNTADTLAWAYYNKGIYGFARDLLKDAVTAEPNDAAMQYHLGMVYDKLRDKPDAVIHLKKALSLAPDSPVGKQATAALQGIG
jgi:tetratricopeptide (TPR) repeat protein